MKKNSSKLRIYSVVDVMSGVAVGVESFPQLDAARRFLRRLRKGRDLNEDDLQLFEGFIDLSAPHHGVASKSRARPAKSSGTNPSHVP